MRAQAATIPAEALRDLHTPLRRRRVDAVLARTGRIFNPRPSPSASHSVSPPTSAETCCSTTSIGCQRQVVRYRERRTLRTWVVLPEDYDIALGRLLTQRVDQWLNAPRRPQEASDTSGQEVCSNGCLNLSVLDGWWPEGFDGTHGWAIPSAPESDFGAANETERDRTGRT